MALVGVFVIKGVDSSLDWFYLGCGLASALISGLAYVAVRKCKDTDHPIQVVLYFPLIATPIMATFCIFEFVIPQGIEWLYVLLIGLFTQVAQINMTKALHADTAANVTPLKYLGAIFAVIIGFTIFDERLNLFNFIGIGLILCGVLLNSFRKKLGLVSSH